MSKRTMNPYLIDPDWMIDGLASDMQTFATGQPLFSRHAVCDTEGVPIQPISSEVGSDFNAPPHFLRLSHDRQRGIPNEDQDKTAFESWHREQEEWLATLVCNLDRLPDKMWPVLRELTARVCSRWERWGVRLSRKLMPEAIRRSFWCIERVGPQGTFFGSMTVNLEGSETSAFLFVDTYSRDLYLASQDEAREYLSFLRCKFGDGTPDTPDWNLDSPEAIAQRGVEIAEKALEEARRNLEQVRAAEYAKRVPRLLGRGREIREFRDRLKDSPGSDLVPLPERW